MSRRGGAFALLALAVVGTALLLPYLVRSRADNERVRCMNNLRVLATFAAAHADPERRQPDLPPSLASS